MKPYVCLLIGLTYATSHAQTRFALARYQMNGTPDATFGAGGKVGTKFQDPVTQADIPAELKDLVLMPSSSDSIAVGTAGNYAAIASYTSRGGLNPAFNNGAGTRVLHLMTPPVGYTLGANTTSVANAVAVKHGKIVVAGYVHPQVCGIASGECQQWSKRFAVARFNVDGSLDLTFGGTGRITVSFEDYSPGCGESAEATAIAVDSVDRIVIGGTARCSTAYYLFAVARHNWNGTPDSTFGQIVAGKAMFDLVRAKNWTYVLQTIRALTTDLDGNIIATGTVHKWYPVGQGFTGVIGESSFVFLKLLMWGPLDSGFNQTGILHVASSITGTDSPNEGRAVSLLPDGRIVTAGGRRFTPPGLPTVLAFTVARIHGNGQMDGSFSYDGLTTTFFQNGPPFADSIAHDVAVIGDKILAVGASGPSIAMARYTSNGELDPSFDGDGKLLARFSRVGSEAASAVALPEVEPAWFLIGGTANAVF